MRAGMITGGLGWVRARANGSAGEGLFQPEHQRPVVRGLQRIQPLRQGLADGVALHPALQRGDAVPRQHLVPVMEHQAVAQPDRPAPAVVLR